ncbi:MAG: BON domain-containing protein [Chloroflexi bacterium]|nr:BON domain-containing protein [Chloroflexota bacterium]
MRWLYGFALGLLGGFALGALLLPRRAAQPCGLLRWLGLRGAGQDSRSGLMPDERITRAVRERLAARGLDTPRLDVTTVDNVVYLRGRVGSSDERAAVVGVARETPGVARVVDELKLPEAAAAND